jgi:hypothetical protein
VSSSARRTAVAASFSSPGNGPDSEFMGLLTPPFLYRFNLGERS